MVMHVKSIHIVFSEQVYELLNHRFRTAQLNYKLIYQSKTCKKHMQETIV